jgi:WKF domain
MAVVQILPNDSRAQIQTLEFQSPRNLVDRRNFCSCAAMVTLNKPKWKKFLSLKGQSNNSSIVASVENGASAADVPTANPQPTVETPKKRKRSEEEIARRKAKKIKSKGKESQEWKQLSEDHEKTLSAAQNTEHQTVATESTSEETKSPPPTDQTESAQASKAQLEAALLSTKAKEIAKARRDEKLQEKEKPLKKPVKDVSLSDKKADQVLQYLEDYRAHVDSGSKWKFKKQHQNWIVKHLYSYAWKDNGPVVGYLKTVLGKARERLVADANEIVRQVGEDEKAHGEDVVKRAHNVIKALSE